MDVDWQGLPRTGQATVVGGALVAVGTVLPWMSYSGGSASLLQDGKMEVVLSTGMSTDTATVATSQTMGIALLLAAIAIGLPLLRGWDWTAWVPALVVGTIGFFLFMFSAVLLHGGGQEAALVGGDRVAGSATPGTGLYAALAGTVVATLGSLAALGSTALERLQG
jgi:fatty acid desaturase